MNGRPRVRRRTLALALGMCLGFPVLARKQESDARLPFATGKQRAIFLALRVDSRPAVFILDTGATVTYVDVAALKLDITPRFMVPVQQTNQKTNRGVYELQLQLGEEKISGQFIEIDLTGTRRECACEVVGLLGMDVLSRYASVEIDFRERLILLRR